jgi:hypothetical protein
MIFKPVRYMRMPATLEGLTVHSVAPSDLDGAFVKSLGSVGPNDQVFALAGLGGHAWVVSGVMAWHEDDGDDSDPSHFSVPRTVW